MTNPPVRLLPDRQQPAQSDRDGWIWMATSSPARPTLSRQRTRTFLQVLRRRAAANIPHFIDFLLERPRANEQGQLHDLLRRYLNETTQPEGSFRSYVPLHESLSVPQAKLRFLETTHEHLYALTLPNGHTGRVPKPMPTGKLYLLIKQESDSRQLQHTPLGPRPQPAALGALPLDATPAWRCCRCIGRAVLPQCRRCSEVTAGTCLQPRDFALDCRAPWRGLPACRRMATRAGQLLVD